MRINKHWIIFLLFTLIYFGSSFRFGFSQDDFYFLLISRANSLKDVISFFSPFSQQGFPFYRPLGTQLYFFLSTLIFGFIKAPYFMHVVMILLQATAAYYAYKLTKILTRDSTTATLLGILYATASAQFLSLYYIAATQQLFAATFSLISLTLFFEKRPRRSALFLALALLSKENAIVLPVIAFTIFVFSKVYNFKKFSPKRIISLFLPYVVVVISYLFLRYTAGIQVQSEYHPVIGPSLISSLRWYFFFTFGAPELLLNYAKSGLYIDFVQYVKDFGTVALLNSLTFMSLSIYVLYRAFKGITSKISLEKWTVVMLFMWWLISIGLIIWFPDHRYPHYLDLGLVPMYMLLLSDKKTTRRLLLSAILLLSSYTSIKLSVKTHWTVGRAKIGEKAIARLINSDACNYNTIKFYGPGNSAQELSYVLSLANGPRYICKNEKLEVIYENNSLGMKEKSANIVEDVFYINSRSILP